jgi:hypothetical protein
MGLREYLSMTSFSSAFIPCIDRDPSRFNMSPRDVQCRRNLFWEIFSADHFHVGDVS